MAPVATAMSPGLWPCTGNIFWEPDNCVHCVRMEDDLKVLNNRSRYTQLGRIKALLNEVKRKVEVKEPLKKWQYLPIFEYKFKKFGTFQPDTVQSETETLTVVDDGLIPMSPARTHWYETMTRAINQIMTQIKRRTQSPQLIR